MAQMYKNIKTGVKAELVEINEKTKQVTLKKADGKFTASNKSAFEKYWKLISDDTKSEPASEEKPVEEKKEEPTVEPEKEVKKEKAEKPKKEKKAREPKEFKPVAETLKSILEKNNIEYKHVGKRIKVLVENKPEIIVIPNKNNAKIYLKEESKFFDKIAKIVELKENTYSKSKYRKTGTVEFESLEKLF